MTHLSGRIKVRLRCNLLAIKPLIKSSDLQVNLSKSKNSYQIKRRMLFRLMIR